MHQLSDKYHLQGSGRLKKIMTINDKNFGDQLGWQKDMPGGETSSFFGAGIQEILDALPFYVMLIDKHHHILLANKATREALQLEPHEIIGGYCPRVVHGIEEGTYAGCPLEEAVEKNCNVQREHFDDKQQRWLRIAIYPTGTWSAGGEEIYFHMVEDITEKKELMAALEETKEIYRKLFESSSRHEKK